MRTTFFLMLVAACGGTKPAAAPPAPPSPRPAPPVVHPSLPTPDPMPPEFRLATDVRPTWMDVALELDPARETFSGVVTIDLEVGEARPALWLNGAELTVDEATFDGQAVRVITGEQHLGFVTPVEKGAHRLVVKYRGEVESVASSGIFRQRHEGDWYLYTQFEPTDARRAFPCFDEPSFKVPWSLAITAPDGLLVASNTPITSREGKTVRFAATPPLPSYLVAFTVGPFDVVDAGTAGKNKTPIRFLVLKGKKDDVRFAAEATKGLLAAHEDYYGIPYPYAKLDSVTIPQTVGWSAMENPGLITYTQTRLLARPDEETISWKRGAAGIISHELAHQWFGDLVTLAFWDDIWLNEAFANWAGRKAVHAWQPTWEADIGAVLSRGGAMSADRLISARQVRQPITSSHDIENAFDFITYGKGSAVLTMVEHWMGEAGFQAGTRTYLDKHGHATATSADFIAAIAARKPEAAVVFKTFLEQAGAPLVGVALECAAGAEPHIRLNQERYLPAGSAGSTEQAWAVPVCARWDGGKGCFLLTKKEESFALGTKSCPKWLVPNAGATGYYRARTDAALIEAMLARAKLTLAERLGLFDDLEALVDGGRMPVADLLAVLPRFLEGDNRHLVASAASLVGGLDDFVAAEDRPRYVAWVRKLFGARAKKLGLLPKKGESDDAKLLRPVLVGLVADEGEDPALIKEATKLAGKWLDDRKAIPEEAAGLVLGIAAANGDAKLHDRLVSALARATERRERNRILAALSSFRDPALIGRTQKLAFTDGISPKESIDLALAGLGDPRTRDAAWAFVMAHYDEIAEKIPADWRRSLISAGSDFCTPERRDELATFFEPKAPIYPGGPRTLAQTLERIDLCVAARATQEPSVAAFLRKK